MCADHVTIAMGTQASFISTGPQQSSGCYVNDRSPAENLMGRKSRTIHNALLSKDSILPNSFSCAKKTLATGRAACVRDHRPNAHEQKVSSELSEKLETGPLDIILDVFGLPPLGNNGTPEIQPSNQQDPTSNPLWRRSRKPPKRFPVNPTFKSYDGELSSGGVG
ncbi:hypothetical protein ACTXT7_016595 [Hymenolepis weldensis]